MNTENDGTNRQSPEPNSESGWLKNESGGPVSHPDTTSRSDVDDIFALDEADLSPGPRSFAGKLPAIEDSAIPFHELPVIKPAAPASGWLDSRVGLPKPQPDSPPIPISQSDIMMSGGPGSRAGSDVIGGLVNTTPAKSNSSIFDAPPPGSSRFMNPTEPTEEHIDSPQAMLEGDWFSSDGDQLDELESEPMTEQTHTDSEAVANLFKTPIPPRGNDRTNKPNSAGENYECFNEVSKDISSSNLFEDAIGESDEMDYGVLGSGVNLANPNELAEAVNGPSSSIFSGDIAEIISKDSIDLDHIPIMASNDEASDAMRFTLDQDENKSSIFDNVKKKLLDPESVFGEVHSKDPLASAEMEAGAIDWQLPNEIREQVSQRMAVGENDLDLVEDEPEAIRNVVERESGSVSDKLDTDWDALAGELPVEPSQTTQDAFNRDDLGEAFPPISSGSRPGLTETAGLPFAAVDRPEPATVKRSSKKTTPSRADFDSKSPPSSSKGSGVLGWLGGSALGLTLGVGACTGAYFTGILPGSESSKPVAVQPLAPPAPRPTVPENPTTPTVDARSLLAAGDPVQALAALESLGESAPVAAKADRGQARWLARLRTLANNPTAITAADPQIQKAEADLQAVVNAADQLQTPEDKQSAVRAALHLGLIKEMTGDVSAATKIYTDALAKYPASVQVFQTALNRLKLTRGTTGQQSHLQPREMLELAQTAAIVLSFWQEPAGPAASPTEPGYLFWEAANQAASGQYDEAIKQIAAAKKLHEQRRLLLAGKGTNPLSDPLEQIFLRNCDDLTELWKLKKELYGHPKHGSAIAKTGPSGVINSLDEQLKTLTDQAKDYQQNMVGSLQKQKEAMQKADLAKIELQESELQKKQMMEMLTMVKAQLLESQTKMQTASAQFQKADGYLTQILKELKVNKLVGEQDDTATVMQKLPTVLREASAASASADAKKAAEALLLAKKERDVALAQAKDAMTQADKAQELAKQAMANLDKARADADSKIQEMRNSLNDVIKKAVTAAQAEQAKTITQLTEAAAKARADLAAQQNDFQTRMERSQNEMNRQLQAKDTEWVQKLQQNDRQYQQAISDARAGAAVPLTSGELIAKDRAGQAYGRGVDFYFANQLVAAEASFTLATSLDPADARYWYFLGLTRTLLGRPDAEAAYRRGAEQERRGMPASQVIDDALERVQGTLRQTLSGYRPR